MDLIKSLSELFKYAQENSVPITTLMIAAFGIIFAWISKKMGGKALSVVGGILTAADKAVEGMQKRLDAMQQALERSENLNEHYRQQLSMARNEKDKLQGELDECYDSYHQLQQKLKELEKEDE